jgi:hypothetical protein
MDTETTAVATAARGMTVRLACTTRDLWHAQRLVAEGYALLSVPPRDVDEVYREFYPSGASLAPQSPGHRVSTFVARDGDRIVATMSLIWCQSRACPRRYDEIEGLRLLQPDTPWSEQLGFAPHDIAELTRFAIQRDYQGSRDAGSKLHMFRLLLSRALAFADRQRVGVVLAVMPLTVTRLVAQAGVAIRLVPGVDLAYGDADCLALYDRYPRYWRPEHARLAPRLYLFGDRGPMETGQLGTR